MEKQNNNMNDRLENMKLIQIVRYLKDLFKSKKKRFRIQIIATIVGSIYVTGLFVQYPLYLSNTLTGVYPDPVSVLYVYFCYLKITLLLSLVMMLLITYGIMYFSRLLVKNYDYDENTDTKVAKDDGTFGTAHWMTEDEKQKAMIMSKDVKDINECILGIDNEEIVYARKPVRFTNGNVLIIGSPAAGKSVCIVNDDVLQYIKMGQSEIVIDTKGKVYADTAYVAEKAEYNIKVFNIKPDEVQYSDACDLLSTISDDPIKAKSEANSLTNTFMSNMNDDRTKKDIWYTGAYNLLKSMILIVKFDKTIPKEERTLGTLYDILIENSNFIDLEMKYDYIKQNRKHPAYDSWMTYTGTRDVVRESILGGLLTSLNFMANDYVKEIVSRPEIDFRAPGFEKCLYYIIIDDEDRSNNILATLFIESLILQLKNAADSQKKGKELSLPITVNIEIDEARQVGKLPMFTEKLSSVRSRGINIKTIWQDLSQIKQLYPNEEWRTVIGDCTTTILLKVGEQATAEYYSKEMGNFTYLMDNKKYEESITDPLHLHPDYASTEGKGKRALMTPEEIKGQGERGLQDDELLVLIDGQAPLKLNKYMWFDHPMYKALHLDLENRRRYTKDHVPNWYNPFIEKRNAEEQEIINIQNAIKTVPGNSNMAQIDLEAMLGGKKDNVFKKKKHL